jgi:hypothetical protein
MEIIDVLHRHIPHIVRYGMTCLVCSWRMTTQGKEILFYTTLKTLHRVVCHIHYLPVMFSRTGPWPLLLQSWLPGIAYLVTSLLTLAKKLMQQPSLKRGEHAHCDVVQNTRTKNTDTALKVNNRLSLKYVVVWLILVEKIQNWNAYESLGGKSCISLQTAN